MLRQLRSAFQNLIDGGIPPDDPRYADVAFMRRLRTLNGAVLGLMVACPITAAIFRLTGTAVSTLPVVLIGLAGVGVCILVRRGGSLDAGIHAVVGSVVALMVFRQAEFGGVEMVGQAWIYRPGMVAGLTLGVRGAAFYTAVLSLQIAVFAWLESQGIRFPTPVPAATQAWYTGAVQILFGWALFVVVMAFLAAQRTAERQLLLANRGLAESRDRAQEATRAKSQFLANMSHEIRTPMNVIFGMTEIIEDEGGLSAEQRDCLQRARHAATTLLALVDDILDVSKIEAGRMELDEVVLNLGALLEDATDLLAPRAAAKGLRVRCRIAPALRRPLVGDPGRIRQIVTNLVGNAVKFTDHGEVSLTATVVVETDTHTTLAITVKDTGIGIPADRHRAVFESFTQADGSSTRRYGGTGLGLTICRELVQLMGGQIGLTSTPGVGSEFRVVVPLAKPVRQVVPRRHAANSEDTTVTAQLLAALPGEAAR